MTEPFSVCMSIYRNDKVDDFIVAIKSIFYQTCPPSEIVLVQDGPVSEELKTAVIKMQAKIPILKVVALEKNVGHAGARQAALDAANHDLIAIMDSDDISVPNRFELQLKAFKQNPDTSVVGGQIKEFIGTQDNIVGERIVPVKDAQIKTYLKSRCPINLVTVMYRKSDVQAVGGFIDWYCEEDYYLWIRLALARYKFYNVSDNLVYVRVGKKMYQRRGGWKYFKSEASLQSLMLQKQVISRPRYLFNVIGRFAVQVAMPNSLRGYIFQKLFRK